MKIACLGWGSLIWRPEGLLCQAKWFEDGPILPIELARISKDNRVTLIIDKEAKPVRTLWTLMLPDKQNDCVESLALREGTNQRNIAAVSSNEDTTDSTKTKVKEWLILKGLDSAIWTDLSYSAKTENRRPTSQDIINHLSKLTRNELRNAEEYIRKAPRQIDTEFRRQIELKFGWTAL